MGFLDDLKDTIKTETDGVKKNVKTAQLQSELNDLKREEIAIYANIGRTSVLDCGAESFGEDGEKLLAVQEKIAAKEAEIAEVKGPEPQRVCPKCETACSEDMKFCPKCGARLE